jgi:hypothetical protein
MPLYPLRWPRKAASPRRGQCNRAGRAGPDAGENRQARTPVASTGTRLSFDSHTIQSQESKESVYPHSSQVPNASRVAEFSEFIAGVTRCWPRMIRPDISRALPSRAAELSWRRNLVITAGRF